MEPWSRPDAKGWAYQGRVITTSIEEAKKFLGEPSQSKDLPDGEAEYVWEKPDVGEGASAVAAVVARVDAEEDK